MALKMVTKPVKPVMMVAPPAPIPEPVVIPHKVLVEPSVSEVEALTAEYIALYQKFDYFEVKALVARMDEVRKQLVAIANDTMDATKPAIFACQQGEVEFSVRGTKTEIPNPLILLRDLLDKFGPDVTASLVDIALTPLRKVLSEAELKKYLKEEPGGRTLRSVRPL
jgi:hypothetical protein